MIIVVWAVATLASLGSFFLRPWLPGLVIFFFGVTFFLVLNRKSVRSKVKVLAGIFALVVVLAIQAVAGLDESGLPNSGPHYPLLKETGAFLPARGNKYRMGKFELTLSIEAVAKEQTVVATVFENNLGKQWDINLFVPVVGNNPVSVKISSAFVEKVILGWRVWAVVEYEKDGTKKYDRLLIIVWPWGGIGRYYFVDS